MDRDNSSGNEFKPEYEIVAKHGNQCSQIEIEQFAALVRAGGEVQNLGLEQRIKAAECLVFLDWRNCLSGVAALKNPHPNHRNEVSICSGVNLTENEFPFELGYIFIVPKARRRGLSIPLVDAALATAGRKGVFATSRTTNMPMHKTLIRLRFESVGRTYASRNGSDQIQLFLRQQSKKTE